MLAASVVIGVAATFPAAIEDSETAAMMRVRESVFATHKKQAGAWSPGLHRCCPQVEHGGTGENGGSGPRFSPVVGCRMEQPDFKNCQIRKRRTG